ncbi:hypothetical protein GE061_007241 [Apolygus lucorum]|uniref:Uncharacterized protein n=1 Tax=Apolygus lucorum TaxID=248454 RepID=A0A8S9WTR8_APOLU|nr:hypothetical protein GE061_007241 [Apolygus lucorum]
MEYYLTTYTKDYKWPVRHSPSKAKKAAEHRDQLVQEQVRAEPCSIYKSQPLEDPIIDPAQCGAPPAGPESKYGQPLTYLKKLYLKYPYLYQILKLTPPEELAKTIYADKYISTYTSDYKVEGFSPLKGYLIPESANAPDQAKRDGLEWPEQTNLNESEKICSPNKQGICDTPPQPLGDQAALFIGLDSHKDEPATCGCVEAARGQMKATHPVKKIARKVCTISRIPRPPLAGSRKKQEEKRSPEYTGGTHPPKLGKWKTDGTTITLRKNHLTSFKRTRILQYLPNIRALSLRR